MLFRIPLLLGTVLCLLSVSLSGFHAASTRSVKTSSGATRFEGFSFIDDEIVSPSYCQSAPLQYD
jgi:hypothetical protein